MRASIPPMKSVPPIFHPSTDVAVLRIATGVLPVATLGDAGALRPGNLVLALARLDDSGALAAFGAVSVVGGAWRPGGGGEIDRLILSDVNQIGRAHV